MELQLAVGDVCSKYDLVEEAMAMEQAGLCK